MYSIWYSNERLCSLLLYYALLFCSLLKLCFVFSSRHLKDIILLTSIVQTLSLISNYFWLFLLLVSIRTGKKRRRKKRLLIIIMMCNIYLILLILSHCCKHLWLIQGGVSETDCCIITVIWLNQILHCIYDFINCVLPLVQKYRYSWITCPDKIAVMFLIVVMNKWCVNIDICLLFTWLCLLWARTLCGCLGINPFTAPAHKISRLKSAYTCLQTVYFSVLCQANQILILCILTEIFSDAKVRTNW